MKILVTGGAGYIGSHTASLLISSGFEVVVFDNLSTGFVEAVPSRAKLVQGDVRNEMAILEVLENENIKAVVHFAGKLNVQESTQKPLDYYEHNTLGVVNLAKAMLKAKVKHIVFSSTAALFGDKVQDRKIHEDDTPAPLNPYGNSKLASEFVLRDVSQAGFLTSSCLRYFNVAGAASDGTNGQRTADAYHLIHLATQTATGQRPNLKIFGNDYPTPDGTCIRDYIHVEDLADIHLLALQYLLNGNTSQNFNCGYGNGYSVKEVIETVKKVSGVDFSVSPAPRRPGDAACLVADPSRLKKQLHWVPKRNNLERICMDAYNWEKSLATSAVKK